MATLDCGDCGRLINEGACCAPQCDSHHQYHCNEAADNESDSPCICFDATEGRTRKEKPLGSKTGLTVADRKRMKADNDFLNTLIGLDGTTTTAKVIAKIRELIQAYQPTAPQTYVPRLPDTIQPRFCPYCASATLVRTTSDVYGEIGCWNGKAYCFEGNLAANACTTCDGVFTPEPAHDVHGKCDCENNSGCECGRYQAAHPNEYCSIHPDWQLAGAPCGQCKGDSK